MKLGILACIAALACAAAPAAVAQAPARLSHHLSSTHFIHKAAEQFAADVKEGTGGKVNIRIYPSAQLYEADNAIQALLQGTVDLAMVSVRGFAQYVPAVDAVSLPYLFKSDDAAREAMNGAFGKKVRELIEAKLPTKVLGYMEFGPGNLWVFRAGKPVRTPDDWKGLKIRAPMEGVETWITRAGGQPVNIPSNDIYSALETGLLDGTITNTTGALDRKWNEVGTRFTETPSPAIWIVLVFASSKQWWDRLTLAQQQVVEAAARRAEETTQREVKARLLADRAKIQAKASSYYIVEPPVFEQWTQLAEPIWRDFVNKNGADGATLKTLAGRP